MFLHEIFNCAKCIFQSFNFTFDFAQLSEVAQNYIWHVQPAVMNFTG